MSRDCLSRFFRRAGEDNRISTTHISLFLALYMRWNGKGVGAPVSFRRMELMEAAKISGTATYHKAIRELAEYGYIRYIPSYNPALCSQVYLRVAGDPYAIRE